MANTNNNVVSALAAVDLAGKEHLIVTLTSTGIRPAAAGEPITGTLLMGNLPQVAGFVANAHPCDVALKGFGLHFATLGVFNNAAIAKGALLSIDPSNPGCVIPQIAADGDTPASVVVAQAWDAVPAPIAGGIFTVRLTDKAAALLHIGDLLGSIPANITGDAVVGGADTLSSVATVTSVNARADAIEAKINAILALLA